MSYEPTHPGEEITTTWLYEELGRISAEMNKPARMEYEVLSIEPEKPQEGTVAFADGSGWNPGAGAGLYEYRSGAWQKL